MILSIKNHSIDTSKPLDISLPLQGNTNNPIAWYQNAPEIKPVIMGNFVGSVASGTSSTNFNNVFFNPHAHGTHTECLGHITKEFYSINQLLKEFFFTTTLVSVTPKKQNEDFVIEKHWFEFLETQPTEAVVIRTLPNTEEKKHKNYSNTNPPYLLEETTIYLREKGVKHLLIDLPSVDKEVDEGKLVAHKAFWNVKDTQQLNEDARMDCTITEMIFVENHIKDGYYLLNLQIASFENDASPSKPVLYEVIRE
ncbi:cyclase family protein [Capnocytophaga sp. ARDL2]|uniref:cyclase family protein n=1 Tax=Capnocytophaga sp. ARDL2 TaxID=3238809 RepID=UPI0035572657